MFRRWVERRFDMKRKGITVIELLFIVAIILILSRIVVPHTADPIIAHEWNVAHGGISGDDVSDLRELGYNQVDLRKMSPDEVRPILKSIVRNKEGEILNADFILVPSKKRNVAELSAELDKLQKELETIKIEKKK